MACLSNTDYRIMERCLSNRASEITVCVSYISLREIKREKIRDCKAKERVYTRDKYYLRRLISKKSILHIDRRESMID